VDNDNDLTVWTVVGSSQYFGVRAVQTLLSMTNSATFPNTAYNYSVVVSSGSAVVTFSARQDPSYSSLSSQSIEEPHAAGGGHASAIVCDLAMGSAKLFHAHSLPRWQPSA
jgi:hypothetical protein